MVPGGRAWLKIVSDRPPRGLKTASRCPKLAGHGPRWPPIASSRAWLKKASTRPQESLRSSKAVRTLARPRLGSKKREASGASARATTQKNSQKGNSQPGGVEILVATIK
eukprot:7954990-Pyramimonas_sp.AAC.1